MALALSRFVDSEVGKIILDGIDITTIGLDDLRSRLTIIPQGDLKVRFPFIKDKQYKG